MPYFNYNALDENGAEKTGTIIAENQSDAVQKLKERGLYLTKIHQLGKEENLPQKKKKINFFISGRVKGKDVVLFIRDLSTLIDAGISIIRSLRILTQQTSSPALRKITEDLATNVESGHPLSESIKKYPNVFPEMHTNLIRAGELGGGNVLSQVLLRLADLCENTQRLNARIFSAMIYPIIVLTFAMIVVTVMITFVLPKFFVIYEDFDLTLPTATMVLFNISTFMQHYWWLIIVFIGLIVFGIKTALKVPHIRLWWDGKKLYTPVFGELFRKLAISRFSRNLGTLLDSGIPILQALDLSKEAAANKSVAAAITNVKNSIREGENLAEPLSNYPMFPPMVINMIGIGEETGRIGEMLLKISDKYDDETERTVSQLTSLLEPFLILFLGIIVLFIIIALFMPLISIYQQLSV